MSITMPCIMTDSAQPPLRLISRWKYDPASDSFHIGRGSHYQYMADLIIIHKIEFIPINRVAHHNRAVGQNKKPPGLPNNFR
jgi:hypothetical protein